MIKLNIGSCGDQLAGPLMHFGIGIIREVSSASNFIRGFVVILWILLVLGVFAFKYWRYKSRGVYIDDPPKESILYRESTASGRSLKSWRTRWGGASNCLKLIITSDQLLVTPIFPFSIIAPDGDLIHKIAINDIESVTPTTRPFRKSFRIRYRAGEQAVREIELMPKKAEQFAAILNGVIAGKRAGRTPSSNL